MAEAKESPISPLESPSFFGRNRPKSQPTPRKRVIEIPKKAGKNLTCWLNKDSWSVFDYRPNIDNGHRLYNPLVKALRDQQQKIVTVDDDKKYIDKFRENASDKKKYETCDMKSLQIFLNIVDTYKSVSDSSVVLAHHRVVNHPRVKYDSCLNSLLGASTISLL